MAGCVRKLQPAECLEIRGATSQARYYWTPSYSRTDEEFAELKAEFFASLESAVAAASGDASSGAFLSGGLDSSTVCGLFQRQSDQPIRAFSVGFSDEAYNELEYAETAASHFGLDHRKIVATTDAAADCIDDIFASFDEPFGNSSIVPTFLCARFAKESGVDVLLAGDGGDELFAGNVRYAKQKMFEQYFRVPGFLRRGLAEPVLLGLFGGVELTPIRKLRRYVEQARVPLPGRMESYNHLENRDAGEVFDAAFLAAIDTSRPSQALSRSLRRTR